MVVASLYGFWMIVGSAYVCIGMNVGCVYAWMTGEYRYVAHMHGSGINVCSAY